MDQEASVGLASALSKAQAEMQNPLLNKEVVSSYLDKKGNWKEKRYKYSDLTEVLRVIKPPLNKHGLSVIQTTGLVADTFCLVTRLIHDSGQQLESHYPLKAYENAQQDGTALTYARRYALCAMFAIAGEEDDDADSIKDKRSETVTKASSKPKAVPETKKMIDHPFKDNKADGGVFTGKTFEQIFQVDQATGFKWTKQRHAEFKQGLETPWVVDYLVYAQDLGLALD